MRSTLRLLTGLAFLVAAATGAFAAQAQISGIDKIYLRAGPGSEEPAISVLSAGDPVDIIDIEGSWTKVQTADGKIGYVYHRYVIPRVGDDAAAGPAQPNPPPALITKPAAPPVAGAAPAAPPAVAASAPTIALPAPLAEKPHSPELTAELATLRAEIADLKEKIQQRQAELGGEGAPLGEASPLDAQGTSSGPTMTPSAAAPLSARDQAVGVLMIAAFSLVIGWVLGSTFGGRRGPRSRGSGRLRF